MIPRYLIEAYAGYHGFDKPLDAQQRADFAKEVNRKIQADSPKRRLEIYLAWNGILGWADRIWAITHTEEYTL